MNKREEAQVLRSQGKTYAQIIELTGLSKSTVSYYCRGGNAVAVYQRNRRKNVKSFMDGYKADAGCIRCGERDPVVLDFHHKDRAEKEFTIGTLALTNKYSIDRVKREIEKCEVMCSNCHRREEHRIRLAE